MSFPPRQASQVCSPSLLAVTVSQAQHSPSRRHQSRFATSPACLCLSARSGWFGYHCPPLLSVPPGSTGLRCSLSQPILSTFAAHHQRTTSAGLLLSPPGILSRHFRLATPSGEKVALSTCPTSAPSQNTRRSGDKCRFPSRVK